MIRPSFIRDPDISYLIKMNLKSSLPRAAAIASVICSGIYFYLQL